MNFANIIKDIRKKNNVTQEEMANKLCVSRQAISNWENNKNLPDIELLILISKEYNTYLDELILNGQDSNVMKNKLINDGSDTKRSKLNLIMTIIGFVLLLLGMLFIVIKGMSVEYIDKDGFLHENFFLLPMGFLFMFSGIITFIVMLINNARIKIRDKKLYPKK